MQSGAGGELRRVRTEKGKPLPCFNGACHTYTACSWQLQLRRQCVEMVLLWRRTPRSLGFQWWLLRLVAARTLAVLSRAAAHAALHCNRLTQQHLLYSHTISLQQPVVAFHVNQGWYSKKKRNISRSTLLDSLSYIVGEKEGGMLSQTKEGRNGFHTPLC